MAEAGCADLGIDPVTIGVDPEGIRRAAEPRVSFVHRSGWLRISEARFEMLFITCGVP